MLLLAWRTGWGRDARSQPTGNWIAVPQSHDHQKAQSHLVFICKPPGIAHPPRCCPFSHQRGLCTCEVRGWRKTHFEGRIPTLPVISWAGGPHLLLYLPQENHLITPLRRKFHPPQPPLGRNHPPEDTPQVLGKSLNDGIWRVRKDFLHHTFWLPVKSSSLGYHRWEAIVPFNDFCGAAPPRWQDSPSPLLNKVLFLQQVKFYQLCRISILFAGLDRFSSLNLYSDVSNPERQTSWSMQAGPLKRRRGEKCQALETGQE